MTQNALAKSFKQTSTSFPGPFPRLQARERDPGNEVEQTHFTRENWSTLPSGISENCFISQLYFIQVYSRSVILIVFSNPSAGQYFRKRLTLANGIVMAGGGIGPLAMGPFYQFILSNHGWRVMLRILSGFAFVVFLCALLYRPLPDKYKKQTKKESRNESGFFDLSVWKMKPFVVWVVSTSLMFIGYFVPFFHLVSRHSLL